MYSKAKIGGHPIHPMIVGFPIVFYTLTFVGFAMYRFWSQDLFWYQLGYFSAFGGVITAVLAAIPGAIDWAFGIPKTSAAKTRGAWHALLNVGALLLFASVAYRVRGTWNLPIEEFTGVLSLSLAGLVLTMVAGFHGWELIATHKVGVSMTPEQIRLEPVEKMKRKDHEVSAAQPRPI